MKTKLPFSLLACIMLLLPAGLIVSCSSGVDPESLTEVKYLSGEDAASAVDWDFFCTGGQNSGEWTQIKVPSCWEVQGFGNYQYGNVLLRKNAPAPVDESGLYRTKFKVSDEWKDRVVSLVFEGVMTDCSVKVNGETVIPLHQGSYYRFSADVSDIVRYGGEDNLLEVTVHKESSDPSVNAAERRADFWNYGGIFRPVYLSSRPEGYIDRVAVDAQCDGSLKAQVFLGGEVDEDFKVVARLFDKNGHQHGRPVRASVLGGKAELNATYRNIDLWTAETPSLYRVRFELYDGSKLVQTYFERIGFRTIEVREEDGLYVNGTKVLIKGVNRHSFRPETGRALSREDCIEDVRLIREMNMNAVRMCHYPPDVAFLDACDSLGLYVMDEVAGWHGYYSTEVGTPLVEAFVARDQNHPSVIWWSNGNEGGFNFDLEPVFKRCDIQQRPVVYPWLEKNGFQTQHYPYYDRMKQTLEQTGIYMPTEILHGLYDGGHGAGLWDFWELLRHHDRAGGFFLWSFADEGVVRTDEGGRIDCADTYAPDGIVGPHLEKEGSFWTVRHIWSPVHVLPYGAAAAANENLAEEADQCSFIPAPDEFAGRFKVENRYDFLNLDKCSFSWRLVSLAQGPEDKVDCVVIAEGEAAAGDIPPHAEGTIEIGLPADWQDGDALYLTAYDPRGDEVFTWGYYWKAPVVSAPAAANAAPAFRTEGKTLVVTAGAKEIRFDRSSGNLVKFGSLSLSGPRMVIAKRTHPQRRNNPNWEAERPMERTFENIAPASRLTSFDWKTENGLAVVTATYDGPLKSARWSVGGNGEVMLDYEYLYEEPIEMLGVCLDYPEDKVEGMRFLGKGPSRVWQNRMHGPVYGVWDKPYNDPIPGETFDYPEFKGYFADWQWAGFNTAEGKLTVRNGNPGAFLGVFAPRDGNNAMIFTMPQTGIAFLDIIPGVGNKGHAPEMTGPAGQPRQRTGVQRGRVLLTNN